MLLPSQQRISALMRRLLLCYNSRHPSPPITLFRHVTALNLSCSFLYGTFPSNSTLFFLRNPESLNLASNDFRLSKIPLEISQFTRLKHLDISYSRFSSHVPGEIAHLPKLVSLNLSNYDLILETTTFKNLVHNLSEVRELELSEVNMTSVNPRFFMNRSSSLTTLVLFEKRNLTIDLPSSNWSSPLQDLHLHVMDCGRRLPESIGVLKSLQSLSLLDCNLEGSIPTSIGNLSQLTDLRFFANHFNGQTPTSLSNLTQLTFLDLSFNQFSDPIPVSIGNLSQLTYLTLTSNNLKGQIPTSLANLTQLTSLDLSNNQFSGPIPTFIGNLRQLTSLVLHSTNLSGQIPSSLANLTQLTFLDLSFNQFSGPIPASIGNLFQLTYLTLTSNNFNGQIPTSLANLTQLTSLYLSSNQFSGPIPASIGNLRQLTGLELSFNNLSGQIPASLANLTQLSNLRFSNNQFSGTIPFHAVRFSKLIDLDLSYNLLNGTLPPWIFTLPLLEYLQLNHNQFQGQIIQFQQNSLIELDMFLVLQNLETIFLSDNNLSLRMNVNANFTLPKLTDVSFSSCNLSEFPNFIRHSNGLQILVLSKNSIHGNIPQWICEKDDLQILDLSHNNLIGKIPNCLLKGLCITKSQLTWKSNGRPLPRSLVNCSKLEVLDVGNNNIEDTFPQWLESLPDLQVLVLRSNKFHGFVQGTKESPYFPKLRVLDLSSNDFRGPLPVRYDSCGGLRHLNPLLSIDPPSFPDPSVWVSCNTIEI
ncbi:hypothetical protein SLEP1_g55904 [Rubroshorea leprosula]|uniref:Disease resistance R13L4/SHOC-2-like LRR domain-containing protein n=1 Tax=Rubroshorea leprosula TaxID=152421 RepID=A0AAV5MJ19_9ROSI|nr:hypothetical protein SLEP1_g55904 [Rubroshorea leprosula]